MEKLDVKELKKQWINVNELLNILSVLYCSLIIAKTTDCDQDLNKMCAVRERLEKNEGNYKIKIPITHEYLFPLFSLSVFSSLNWKESISWTFPNLGLLEAWSHFCQFKDLHYWIYKTFFYCLMEWSFLPALWLFETCL